MAAHLKKRVYEQLSEVVQLPQEEAPAKKLRLTKPIPAALCPQLRGGRECGRGGTHTAGTLLQAPVRHIFSVRNKCLQLLSCLGNVDTPLNKDGQVLVPAMIGGGASGVSGGVCVRDAQSVISDYFSNQDPRVRTAAIKAMLCDGD
ncbi:integrator complex subunit 4-like isoform X2 [Oncorhynchus kisutch]|uniref:integrator complex subunit 4-like isoform X2 n=1 Tax=Oncorhynchus kisutch TaxID=8019 RepID=UPI00099F5791|nr:integrator complex subunit 4-like isoform X2 [Oncorhynchus kisutch]